MWSSPVEWDFDRWLSEHGPRAGSLLSNVDALELQLRRQLDEKQGGTIRNTDPAKIPAGYQESVAEYYRKLSGAGH